MRYGVLHDIATKILQGKPIDVSLGHVNFIWQGDASAQALRCLAHCDTPTSPINVSGHEILAVRDLAAKLGQRLGREPIIVGTEQPTAWLTDTSQAVKLFGLPIVDTDRLIGWTADWVSRVDAEPRQAHQIRGARWPVLIHRHRPARCRRRAGRAGAVDRSALEPERGRLAVLPEPREPCSACATATRLVATAALLPYTSGNAWISMVLVTADWRRRGLATRLVDACLRRRGQGVSRPGSMRRRPAPRSTARSDLRRRCSCGGCGWSRKAPRHAAAAVGGHRSDAFIARDGSAMGFDRSALLAELSARPVRGWCLRRRDRAGPRRPQGAAHRPVVCRSRRSGAGAGRRDRPFRDRAPADRCRPPAGRISARPDRLRLDHRAAVSAHALRPRHRRSPRNRHSPSPARNLDREHAMHHSQMKSEVRRLIADGTVIPAHPLALDADRQLDTMHQRALTRYYIDAGAGGLAVGVHTTQFAIRDVGLYRPVLELAAETAAPGPNGRWRWSPGWPDRPQQAVAEAETARGIGYHAGLLSLAAMKSASEDEIIAHCEAVAREIPLVGFYLQPAVGGVILSADFWRRFASIDNVIAIKIAPFNRYRTLDVLRGVAAAGALDRVALYTGNDDHILLDLDAAVRPARQGRHHPRLFPRRPARPLVGVDRKRGQAVRDVQRRARQGHAAGRSAGARCPRHRLQQRLLRRRQQFSRLHRRLPRGAAAAGTAGGHLVPRSGRGPQPRPDAARSTASAASMPISATTPSSPPICRNGWHERRRALHPPAQCAQGLSLAGHGIPGGVRRHHGCAGRRTGLAGRTIRLRQDHGAEDPRRTARGRRRHHPDRQCEHAVRSRRATSAWCSSRRCC